MRTCTIEGCNEKHVGKGFCGRHYYNNKNNGDPLIDRRPRCLKTRFYKYVKPSNTNECWLWFGTKDTSGYGKMSWKGKKIGAHRISWEIHNQQKVPPKHVVMHKCDNPACVNPNHLSVGSDKDNILDALIKRRLKVAYLTEDEVKVIKFSGKKTKDLANEFNVSVWCVRDIKCNRTWKHVKNTVE